MKLISFVVPAYNSAEYISRCVESLLPAGEEAEIILVDDGSTDETPRICDDYAARFGSMIRVVHQENGGHGEAVNTGLRHASACYFKVVDSDDWLDYDALCAVLVCLRARAADLVPVDLFITNYVYEYILDSSRKVMRYTNVFPQNVVFSWTNIRLFKPSQYLLMHSLIYRTALLRDCGLHLPAHTFYVDNIFAYQPLPSVKSIYYMNVDLYRYSTGRPGQSVAEGVMVKRVEQQVRITRLMLESHRIADVYASVPRLARYMVNYLSMMIGISSVFLFLEGSRTSIETHYSLWRDLRFRDKPLYRRLKRRVPSILTNFHGRAGRKFTIHLYRLLRRIYKTN
jgi:glycosyltransferase involved in cell wall biosynthesis